MVEQATRNCTLVFYPEHTNLIVFHSTNSGSTIKLPPELINLQTGFCFHRGKAFESRVREASHTMVTRIVTVSTSQGKALARCHRTHEPRLPSQQ